MNRAGGRSAGYLDLDRCRRAGEHLRTQRHARIECEVQAELEHEADDELVPA